MGSVLRRMAAYASCAVVKAKVATVVRPQQYGVGRKADCELVHKCVTTLTDEDATRVVIVSDASNALGTSPGGLFGGGVDRELASARFLGNASKLQIPWGDAWKIIRNHCKIMGTLLKHVLLICWQFVL